MSSLISQGTISTKAGKAICYEVLNDAARQLHARKWVMGNFVDISSNGISLKKTEKTIRLWDAEVGFYANIK
jgi:hypothetical protein